MLALAFAGCADTGLDPGMDGPGGEMAFEIGFAGDTQTRVATDAAFNSTWEDGDQIGVFAVKHDETLAATDNYIDNLRLTYDAAANTWTASTAIYWPQDGSALDFYAYHPYDAAFDPSTAEYSVMLDQSGETDGRSDFNVNDWLTAKSNNDGAGYAKGADAVPLEFSHALAMVQTTLDNETDLLDTSGDITVTLKDVHRTFSLNLVAGEATATGDKSDIRMHRVEQEGTSEYATTYTYRALLPAQTLPQGTSLFHITDGATTFRSTALTEALTLVAGQAETFGQRIPLPNVETAKLVFTDGGDPAEITAIHTGDGNYDIAPGGAGTRTVYSITLRGKTHLVGRKDNETFKLRIVPATGELQFRDVVDDGNDGTAIPIGTYAEFEMIGTDESSLAGSYLQDADIDLLGAAELETASLMRQNRTPIGTFTGSYGGGGHTLANLYINNPTGDDVGLFGSVGEGGLLSGVVIASGTVTGNNRVGGVCGYNNGTLSGCTNAAVITGNDETAGVCGRNHQTILECVNTGNVSGTNKVGGLCGWNDQYAYVNDSQNYGSITGNSQVAGVCGHNGENDSITGCSNSGSVTSTNGENTGGVCGVNYNVITECHNTGEVGGTGSGVGGLCGQNRSNGTLTKCYNTGRVWGVDNNVGGVCGRNRDGSSITSCHNSGRVESEGERVGGVCGNNSVRASITACYNTGYVDGYRYVGGVCGWFEILADTVVGCYNTGEVWGDSYVGEVCGYNDGLTLRITYCYFRDGNTAIGGGRILSDTDFGPFEFGENTWPDDKYDEWKLYDNGGYWGDLGSWNGGDPIYPRLWWEE